MKDFSLRHPDNLETKRSKERTIVLFEVCLVQHRKDGLFSIPNDNDWLSLLYNVYCVMKYITLQLPTSIFTEHVSNHTEV